ncbi:alpha/beta hydrolase [Desulfobacca acetoxidans]
MVETLKISPQRDFSKFDRPEILQVLFHPRPELGGLFGGGGGMGQDILIPVADGLKVGGRLHLGGQDHPNILFFHGNGEIVADYDELGPLYNRLGINFLPVDYRGYGRSGGQPTISAMMQDCHTILRYIAAWLPEHSYTGPLLVMGRSLGSASALELAANYSERLAGLILESGFAFAGPLLRLLGVNPDALGFQEEAGFNHIAKIETWQKPLLVIHAEFDHIIPLSDGRALYDACPATDKTFVKIPGANHNDLFYRGMEQYLTALTLFVKKAGSDKKGDIFK